MDLDSAAQNLMETIIKVYICLKTRFSYQRLGSSGQSLTLAERGRIDVLKINDHDVDDDEDWP